MLCLYFVDICYSWMDSFKKMFKNELTLFLYTRLSWEVCWNKQKNKEPKESSWCRNQNRIWKNFVRKHGNRQGAIIDLNSVYLEVKHYFSERWEHRSAITVNFNVFFS